MSRCAIVIGFSLCAVLVLSQHAFALSYVEFWFDDTVTAGEETAPGAARARFTMPATNRLQLVLTNEYGESPNTENLDEANYRIQALGALFFHLADGVQLTTQAVTGLVRAQANEVYDLRSKTKALYDGSEEGVDWATWEPNVGGEWVYKQFDPSATGYYAGDTNWGASAVGYGYFGDGTLFDGTAPDLCDAGTPPDGGDLSILPDIPAVNPEGPLSKDGAVWVSDRVTLTWDLSGGQASWTLDELDISEAWFGFGTDADVGGPGNIKYGNGTTPVPEPASFALLAVAVGGVAAGVRRRRGK